jgi:hypothetical protein
MMDFKITRGQGKCSVTSRAFADGEKYIVALSQDPAQEGLFLRTEISLEAWERQQPGAFVAFWFAEHSARRKPVLLDPDMLWEVFHRARMPLEAPAEGEEPEFTPEDMQRFAYVSALGLMRLKKLKLSGTRRDGKAEYLVFETPGRGKDRQTYEVLNPELDEDGVIKVEERLSELA